MPAVDGTAAIAGTLCSMDAATLDATIADAANGSEPFRRNMLGSEAVSEDRVLELVVYKTN